MSRTVLVLPSEGLGTLLFAAHVPLVPSLLVGGTFDSVKERMEAGRGKQEEASRKKGAGRREQEDGRRKTGEGRREKEGERGKREEGRKEGPLRPD